VNAGRYAIGCPEHGVGTEEALHPGTDGLHTEGIGLTEFEAFHQCAAFGGGGHQHPARVQGGVAGGHPRFEVSSTGYTVPVQLRLTFGARVAGTQVLGLFQVGDGLGILADLETGAEDLGLIALTDQLHLAADVGDEGGNGLHSDAALFEGDLASVEQHCCVGCLQLVVRRGEVRQLRLQRGIGRVVRKHGDVVAAPFQQARCAEPVEGQFQDVVLETHCLVFLGVSLAPRSDPLYAKKGAKVAPHEGVRPPPAGGKNGLESQGWRDFQETENS
jgi:hypothetical protein